MSRELLFIALGGALGAVARYLAGLLASRWLGGAFPYAILAVNVIGCLMIGGLAATLERREAFLSANPGDLGPEKLLPLLRRDPILLILRQGLMIGFVGGLTTFSSFGLDTLRLLEQGRNELALANVALNLLLGLGAVWIGLWCVRTFG